MANPDDVDAVQGSVEIPRGVSVTYSDGSVKTQSVTWTLNGATIDVDQVQQLDPGAYTLIGSVDGTDITPSFTVTIEPATPDKTASTGQEANALKNEDANAPAKVASSASDGWSAQSTLVMPVGFDAESFIKYHGIQFWNDNDESGYYYSLSEIWSASEIDTSKPGTFTKQFTVPESGFGTLGGKTFTSTIKVLEPQQDIPTSMNESLKVTDDPDEIYIKQYQNIALSDGSVYEAEITWNSEQLQNLKDHLDTPGTYTVQGAYAEAPNITITATFWVQDVRTISASSVYTEPGVAPVMPEFVMCEFADGSTSSPSVTWDKIDASQYAESGAFDVQGTVAGTDMKAIAHVYVSKLNNIVEPEVTTFVGQAPETFAANVLMEYDLGTQSLTPDWEDLKDDDSRLQQAGTFEIKDTVKGIDRTFTCTVHVIDAISYDKEININTYPGNAPLPYNMKVTTSDGTTEWLPIDWGGYNYSQFQQPGSFDLVGTLGSGNYKVTAHVKVQNIKSVQGIQSSYDTIEGVIPTLPTNAEVILEDGTKADSNAYIDWELPSPEAVVSSASPLAVYGSVSGSGYRVSTTFNIAWTVPATDPIQVSTLYGLAPELPTTVKTTLSDGTRRDLTVQWSTVDPAKYQTAGSSFEVKGYVSGSDYPVTAQVAVCDVVKTPVSEGTVAAGEAPMYPDGVKITLDNGDTFYPLYGHLVWDEVDPDDVVAGKTLTVTGHVVGSPAVITCTFDVIQATQLMDPEFSGLVFLGAADEAYYQLPDYTTVMDDKGETAEVEITWEEPDPSAFDHVGTVTVKGTAAGMPVTCKITVAQPLKATIEDPIYLSAESSQAGITGYGATVSYTDGEKEGTVSSYVSNITWDDLDVFTTVGTHEATGSGYCGSAEVPVTATITVFSSIESVKVPDAWMVPGSYPNLPYLVDVTFKGVSDDGSETTQTVQLPAYYDIDYDAVQNLEAGDSFVAKGILSDFDYPISCTVKVLGITSFVVPNITVAPGVTPSLPETVIAKLSDGREVAAPVEWSDEIDVSQLQQPGDSVKVTGTAYVGDYSGPSRSVSCTVTVQGVKSVAESAQTALQELVTEPNTMPALPSRVPVELSNGTIASTEVVWDTEDLTRSDFATPGDKVTITGHITGVEDAPSLFSLLFARSSADTVYAEVTVVQADQPVQVSFADPYYLTLPATKASADDLLGYTGVSVGLSDGTFEPRRVIWDTSNVSFDKPGTYTLTGTVYGTDKVTTAYITVTGDTREPSEVQPVKTSITMPEDGFTRQSFAMALPQVVTVSFTDGTSEAMDVNWVLTNVTDDMLKAGETIKLTGNVEGTSLTVAGEFTLRAAGSSDPEHVTPVELAKQISVTTPQNVAPTLPDTVTMTMSDSSKKDYEVTWQSIDQSKLAVTNTFTVYGSLAETGMQVSAEITVVPYVRVTNITWDSPDKTDEGTLKLDTGATSKLDVTVTPQNATYGSYTLSSSNENVVTVDQDGTVKAGSSYGTATIRVATRDMTISIPVVVGTPSEPEVAVSKVTISGEGVKDGSVSLKRGSTLQLTAHVEPENATDQSITWNSTNPDVATVSSTGLVTAKRGGRTTISATSKNGTTSTITVDVPRTLESTSLELSTHAVTTVELGKPFSFSTLSFQLVYTYDNGDIERKPLPEDTELTFTGNVDTSKAGTYLVSASIPAQGTTGSLICQFSISVVDPSKPTEETKPETKPSTGDDTKDDEQNESPDNKPSKNGNTTNTNQGDKDTSSKDSSNKESTSTDEGLTQTDDPSMVAAGLSAAGGVTALVAAWFERRRARRNQ